MKQYTPRPYIQNDFKKLGDRARKNQKSPFNKWLTEEYEGPDLDNGELYQLYLLQIKN